MSEPSSTQRGDSLLEVRPIRTPAERYDVAILGGGLAGLTLAIQLRRERPQTTVLVLEKREGPAPQAAFKVGESTVPSGAHYFAEIVGMRDHLEEHHLKKNGLRFFMSAGANDDITKRPELGGPTYPRHDNYQIDRGVFENALAARAASSGVDLQQGCHVQRVKLGPDGHTVEFHQFDSPRSTNTRWVVDATGRSGVLKRQLGVARDAPHHVNACWMRLGGGLDLEQWGIHDSDWMSRVFEPGIRQYSTNHLFGEGYWVWLIPLATGPISIGVCTDPRVHPFEQVSEFGPLLDWLHRHEPQLGEAIAPRVGEVQDFLRVEDFAYAVERVYSNEGWSLVGEAAGFTDPFYSPGSDMIAYGNVHTCDLIKRALDGEDIAERVDYYNDFYQRTFAHYLARTQDAYPSFGNAWVTAGSLSWGAYVGHAGQVLLMLNNKLTDLEFMRTVDDDLDHFFSLNINMYQLLRQWHELETRPLPAMVLRPFPAVLEVLTRLVDPHTDEQLREAMQRHVAVCEAATVAIFHQAARALGSQAPDPTVPVNPYAVGLRPGEWLQDGLYDEPGMTLAEAQSVIVGVDGIWPPEPETGPRDG